MDERKEMVMEGLKSRWGLLAGIFLLLCLVGFPADASTSYINAQPDIELNGAPIEYQYVDSIYEEAPSGTVGKRYLRTLRLDASTYAAPVDGGWKIEGQTWTDMTGEKYHMIYTNTTGMSISLPDGDYQVRAVCRNVGDRKASISIWDERGKQTAWENLGVGKSVQKTFTVSVLQNNLKLFFAANIGAQTADDGASALLVEEIHLTSLSPESAGKTPTIYIMGDSTAHTKPATVFPREGWGQEFYRCFGENNLLSVQSKTDEENITSYTEYKMRSLTIENRAFSGESTASFWRDGKFDNLLNVLRPGDCVLVQFGHNDAKTAKVGYYASVEEYGTNLLLLAKGCKARGASCLLLSPTPKCVFRSGQIQTALPSYKAKMKQVARAAGVLFVDVGKAVENFMNTVGQKKAKEYYMLLAPGEYPNYPKGYSDKSHYNYKGARKAAQIIGVTLKESGKFPLGLSRKISIESNYYNDVTVDISSLKVKKADKKYKITWPAQKKAKRYVVYQYVPSKKAYKKVLSTKKNSCSLAVKKLNKNRLKVTAELTRSVR